MSKYHDTGEKIFIADKETQDEILAEVKGLKPRRYGFRVKIDESDPSTRVEYLYDAVGKEPAKMNYDTGTFSYGGWEDIWFVTRNYPVVLNKDGSEKYRLNPKDYSQREDGETTVVQAIDTDLPKGVTLDALKNGENVMSAIPCCWVKRYQEGGYRYVIVCEDKYDESYKAYAHTNKNGEVQPYAYHAVYEGWMDNCEAGSATEGQEAIITGCKHKTEGSPCTYATTCTGVSAGQNKFTDAQCKTLMRSVSGVMPTCFTPSEWERAAAQRNGAGWDIGYWSLNELIADLLTLMAKTTNTQEAFGQGHTERNATDDNAKAAMMMKTGTMDQKGQFWGSKSTKPTADQAPGGSSGAGDTLCGVKVFHIENFWGDRWNRQLGMIAKNGNLLVKMTPEGDGYNLTGDGYPAVQEAKLGATASYGWRKRTVQTEYGALPVAPFTGSDSTYETDYFWFQVDSTACVSFFGGSCANGAYCGARCWSVYVAAGYLDWDVGASLTFINPL